MGYDRVCCGAFGCLSAPPVDIYSMIGDERSFRSRGCISLAQAQLCYVTLVAHFSSAAEMVSSYFPLPWYR